MSHIRWNLLPTPELPEPSSGRGLSPFLLRLLHNRGIRRPEEIGVFLAGDRSLLLDPFRLPDMEKAIVRINRALLGGENICVYGDFDADGITATALLVEGLSFLGASAIPYIPHRQSEGHGLSEAALKKLFEDGIRLVITVDCGITDIAEVEKAKEWGLDIIITDHHNPLQTIPQAAAVIDPKLKGADYPFDQLAGVGVAFKLLQGLLHNFGMGEKAIGLADLVAIGTIADMSAPLGENRYLIREGLRQMNENPRPGIRELVAQTRLEAGKLDADRVSWVIAPCLNAAGRLADGLAGYRLLMAKTDEEARELARWLARKNEERQKLTAQALEQARADVIARGLPPLLFTAHRDYPMGVTGLVASRLTEEFYRPSVVVHLGDELCHGSCRSIPEFNIITALNSLEHFFTRYGGHAQAAGFTMPVRDLPELEQRLDELARRGLEGIELSPHLDIDMQLTLPELGGDTYRTIQLLAPFGNGNPVPVFLSRKVELLEKRPMGNGEHFRMKLRQGRTVWDGVAFGLASHAAECTRLIDIVYNLEADSWNGNSQLRLNILDFRKST
ncbi:MAG: single-stranded-DNA-specific exonuclease RecJ [Dehalococcoidales bacterium]|nr:single-stranded-DNA-specific exonuclease RecJ [Dehalococcoidales bacterium]